jgi:MFS family permease
MLLAINLLNYIDRYIVSAVEPLIRDELLAPDDPNAKAKMGSLAPAFLITYMVTSPIFGWLGDRYHRWTIVGLGVLLWTLATGASGLATTFTFLLLMRILVGAGEAAWGPVAPTIIADMYPASKRGWVMSWFYLAIPVGSALGYILGGAIASWKSWHWAFFFAVPPGILLGIWAFFRPDPSRGGVDKAGHNLPVQPHVPFVEALKSLMRNRSYLLNSAAMTAATFAIGGMSFWMPTYIHEYRMGGGADDAGREQLASINFLFGGITVVCGITATLLGGYLSDRLRGKLRGAYAQVAGWSMLIAFPFFLCVLYTPFPYAWGFMAAAIFFMFLNTGPTNTVLANVTAPNIRATAFAINIFLIHALGDAISPTLIGVLSDRTGSMTNAFLLVGIAMVVAGVVWLVGARYLDQDTAKYA